MDVLQRGNKTLMINNLGPTINDSRLTHSRKNSH